MTAAFMTLSTFAGAADVYADELPDGEVMLEEASDGEDIEEAGELTEVGEEEIPVSEDLEDAEDDDVISDIEDQKADNDNDKERSGSKDDIDSPDGNMNQKDVPVSYGEALRFYGDGSFMNENQHIYYGTIPSNAVNLDYYLGADYWYQDQGGGQMPYWRILDHKKDNTDTSGAILLLSEDDWGLVNPRTVYTTYGDFPFDTDNSNDWNNSDSRVWCWCFYYDIFSEKEQAAIRRISKAEGSGEIYYNNTYDVYDSVWDSYKALTIKDEPVFFLSVSEVQKYLKDYYDGGKYYDKFSSFWLRTASNFVDGNLNYGYTYSHGMGIRGIDHVPVGDDDYSAARPAFNIDSSNIIFASDAGAGKVSNGVGPKAVTEVDDECGVRDWRLTLHDSDRDNFKATFSFAANNPNHYVQPGGTINIGYSGAKAETNEYVSVIICDKSGKDILYYGRIANNSESGTTGFTLPTTVTQGETYKVMVFSEQYNGDLTDPNRLDKVTDLASDPTKNSFNIKVAYNISGASLSPTQWNYDGAAHIPAVKHNGNTLTLNRHYTRLITDSKKAKTDKPIYGGVYHMALGGKIENGYYGSCTKDFRIIPWNVSQYTYQSASSYYYNGATHIPSVIFSRTKKALRANTDYTYVIKNSAGQVVKSPVNGGTYSMTITGRLGYTGTVVRSFRILPINNTLNVKKKSKTISISKPKKEKKIKKSEMFKFVNKGVGTKSYSLGSVKKGSEYYGTFFRVKGENLIVRPGVKKGTYTVTINVTAAGNINYKPKTQAVTFKVKIK